MDCKFDDVVLVPFPFTNQSASKQRPAVVVSSSDYNDAKPDVVVMAITSQLRPDRSFGETWIEKWQQAGLVKASAIKPVFATLERSLVIRVLGTLSDLDKAAVKAALAEILG